MLKDIGKVRNTSNAICDIQSRGLSAHGGGVISGTWYVQHIFVVVIYGGIDML